MCDVTLPFAFSYFRTHRESESKWKTEPTILGQYIGTLDSGPRPKLRILTLTQVLDPGAKPGTNNPNPGAGL